MLKLTKRTLPLLFLLLTSLITTNLMLVNAEFTTDQSGMIKGVLAHEMTSQEAQTLAKSNITWVSCDVTFDRSDSSNWYHDLLFSKAIQSKFIGDS